MMAGFCAGVLIGGLVMTMVMCALVLSRDTEGRD